MRALIAHELLLLLEGRVFGFHESAKPATFMFPDAKFDNFTMA